MPSPITSEAFVRLIEQRNQEVFENEWADIPSQIPDLFNVKTSDSAWEEYYGVGSVPDIVPFSGKLHYLSISPGYLTRIEPKEFAGALQFERKLLDDKKYNVLDDQVAGLTEAAKRIKEKDAASLWGGAFSSALDFAYSEEGVSLCSSSHTTKSGASTTTGFDNAGTSTLSKTSLAATWLAMRQFKNDIGERADVNPDMIVVPESLYFTAQEAVGVTDTGAKSQLDPDSGDNTVNTQYNRFKVFPYRRLDDYNANCWFMVDSRKMKKFLIWLDRIMPETKTWVDPNTFSVMWSIYLRYGCGFREWRWIYGHSTA